MPDQRSEQVKLRELILYIASKMEQDRHVGRGRIKLAKLLWRSDFAAFWKFGESITETRYHADEHGPAPVGELLAIRDLEAEGRLEWRNEWDRQQIPVAVGRPPDMDVFTGQQVALIDTQLEQYRFVTGRAMRDEAHEFPGYVHAWRDGKGMHAPVPFESVYWDDRTTVHDWENEHAAALARDLGTDLSAP